MKSLVISISIAAVFLLFGCIDLQVQNLNEPALINFTENTDGIEQLAENAFKTLHNGMQAYSGPGLAMAVMADQNTCSWGTAAEKDLSDEPRRGFTNRTSYAYYFIIQDFWERCYESISVANTLIRLSNKLELENKSETIDSQMLKSWGYFTSGIAHGYLGLIFDKANIVSGDVDIDSLGYASWQEIISYSLTLIDSSVEIANNNTFTIPDLWMGGDAYSNKELAELANSYAARFLAYSSRNKLQNDALDWNRVLQYATNGIQKDLAPELGDNYGFYDEYLVYSIYNGWARIDHRIINLMDSDYPSYWPQKFNWTIPGYIWLTPDGRDPGPAVSEDARLKTDFEYLQENTFRPERGIYHYSHYRHKRYDDVTMHIWYGDISHPSFLVYENELLIAEAGLRLGDNTTALSILNNPDGARKSRGQLANLVTSDASKILWTIFYERDIELMNTGIGIGYFDMRRRDNLQQGTILHFPVPAGELLKTMDEIYTIGGNPDGQNISNGSWTGLDGTTVPPGLY